MKKRISLLVLVSLVFSLMACGESKPAEEQPTSEATSPSVATEEVTEEQPVAEENEEAALEASSLNFMELTPDSDITVEGDYELSGLFTDILTDKSVHDGWFYYYSIGTETNVPWERWEPAEGMYTSCEILFNMKQLNESADKSYGDRFSGVILFNAPKDFTPSDVLDENYVETLLQMAKDDSNVEVYELTPLQDNPEQYDKDGIQARSKDSAILKKNVEAKQSLIADVSEKFYRSWEDENATESMWAFFSYGGNTIYMIDLCEWMEEY